MSEFTGVYVATLTPFSERGAVDFGRAREHLAYLIEAGIPGVCPVGTTGEFPFLLNDEKVALVEMAAQVCRGKAKVIAGVWAMHLPDIRALARRAEEAGADAVFLTTPIYYKYTDRAIADFYRYVRDSTALPVFAYNIPQFTGNAISFDVVESLVEEGAIQGIKDSVGKPESLGPLVERFGERITVFGASDAFAWEARQLGAKGFISALANVYPKAFRALWDGDASRQAQITALRQAVKGYGGTAAIKYLLGRKGIPFGGVRLPFGDLSDAEKAALDEAAAQLGDLD
ncbi:MAG: dihydrodipicolinate synthase family protein [Armatimonadetes bacterium]|nr:dihydrodipicolinate synthase family protein [Armatimonadota bacterium]